MSKSPIRWGAVLRAVTVSRPLPPWLSFGPAGPFKPVALAAAVIFVLLDCRSIRDRWILGISACFYEVRSLGVRLPHPRIRRWPLFVRAWYGIYQHYYKNLLQAFACERSSK